MIQEFDFFAPKTLDELCQTLARDGGRLIAGGTDVIPQMRDGRLRAERLVDLSRLSELRFIQEHDGVISIGALTTYSALLQSSLLQAAVSPLLEAIATVGSAQTRCRGTLGGNVANASPAGDTLPPLLTLNAQVTLISVDGQRTLPLADVLKGPGKTTLQPHEVIQYITIEQLPPNATGVFLKLGNRRGMAISVASAAVVLQVGQEGRVEEARIALGAVAPTAMRCPRAEAVLKGRLPADQLFEEAAEIAAQECSPIDDIRGTADYRRRAVRHLVRRALQTSAQPS